MTHEQIGLLIAGISVGITITNLFWIIIFTRNK